MSKTHDFTKILWGEEFVLEAPLETVQGTMTGQGALAAGDEIIVCVKCRVEAVEHYIDTPDLWQANVTFEQPISLEVLPEKNPLQALRNLLSQIGDSLNQNDLYQRFEQAFSTDRVTQIANRGRLESRLNEAWRQLRREQAPISVILCAFDGLSTYQEAYDPKSTERCLYDIAQTLQNCAKRPADVAARYQDYMFAVLLPKTSEVGAQAVLESICTQLSALDYFAPETKPAIKMRFGLATLTPTADQEALSLIQAAARALS
jgi:diguanylate cyclase (GGDEF)-like protein